MPVPADIVGTTAGPVTHEVDARWTMAYAAALDDLLDVYLDTTRAGGIVAHPVFPVCVEWPVIVASREASLAHGITADEVRRGVHATHDLVVHRLVRPGDRLTTTMTVVGLEQRRPGAYATMRLDTVDADGHSVATTLQGALYLGVPVAGAERPAERPAEPAGPPLPVEPAGAAVEQIAVPISGGAAHTYTECARIWNPIHTDEAVARGAGLPSIILHGTATLAHAVSQVVRSVAGGDPAAVRRVVGRFGAMVRLPSTVTVHLFEPVALEDGGTAVPFGVTTEEGGPAVDRGAVLLG